jgi:2'-hydroxyisoflavone reductase
VKLLILGGTKFVGRALAETALARGHEVTLFTRGRTNPALFPDAEHLRGNRDGDLRALAGRTWDVVVDTSGFVPRVVRASAESLAGSGHYVFVSSISVYRDPLEPGFDETAPVQALGAPTEDYEGPAYGPLKALCEDVVRDVFPDRHTNVRAGLIVGRHDPTGRFTYWPHRVARGGDVLAPGDPARRLQFIDVRDLADWVVRAAETGAGGTFNVTGPDPPVTIGRLLEACRAVTGSEARFVWVDEGFLLRRGVLPWKDLPAWVDAGTAALLQADVSKARADGLRFRRLEDTIRDTLAHARPTSDAGLTGEREAELLSAWAAIA